MVTLLILLAATVLFVFLFMLALYALVSFILSEGKKINRERTVLDVITTLSKVFVISFISFSFFIYSMSFLLRIEDSVLKQQNPQQVVEIEKITLPEEELALSKEEISSPPLFDFLIQPTAEQNQGKQLTFVFTAGGALGLIAVLIMAMYAALRVRNKKGGEKS